MEMIDDGSWATTLGEGKALWEIVAAVQVMQTTGWVKVMQTSARSLLIDEQELLDAAGVVSEGAYRSFCMAFNEAYRRMDSTKLSYQEVLARASGFELKGDQIKGPQFPNLNLQPTENGGIVVCPGEINDAFKLPYTVWKAIIGHTRSYGAPVSLLGGHGIRYDFGSVTEGAVLSEMAFEDRVRAIASAKLVIGCPNEWTWIGMGLGKKVIVFYPDDIPMDRWSGFAVEKRSMGRLMYTRSQIQIPIILSGLRRLIDLM